MAGSGQQTNTQTQAGSLNDVTRQAGYGDALRNIDPQILLRGAQRFGLLPSQPLPQQMTTAQQGLTSLLAPNYQNTSIPQFNQTPIVPQNLYNPPPIKTSLPAWSIDGLLGSQQKVGQQVEPFDIRSLYSSPAGGR